MSSRVFERVKWKGREKKSWTLGWVLCGARRRFRAEQVYSENVEAYLVKTLAAKTKSHVAPHRTSL
jgi:hypothetical protein